MTTRKIIELRILPPFVVGRLGSSPSPMDNYALAIVDPVGARQLVPAPTLVVEHRTGASSIETPPRVRFRDPERRIRPIAPFVEVWARFVDAGDELVPLTAPALAACGLTPEDIEWRVHVANHKAYRRTSDPNDKIDAIAGPFSDHAVHALDGESANFKPGKRLPLGRVQYVRPCDALPEIRLRFTPAAGLVYGPEPGPSIADDVYDASKGGWKGWQDDDNNPRTTIPAEIYATGADQVTSLGYLDDECDGVIEVALRGTPLTAFCRVAVGPPTFAPDSLPVRTVDDELHQAALGPLVAPNDTVTDDEVRDIVRRALETVKLMNTDVQNRPSTTTRGVGMARMDYLDRLRAPEPIMDPGIVDALAVRARHERVLLALESGTLAWFARVLRDHDAVGDLSDAGRRRMPALMRGADGRHLALTRRQVGTIRAAAEQLAAGTRSRHPQAGTEGAAASAAAGTRGLAARPAALAPLNRTAQLSYDAGGNPPSAHPRSAISNAYPGLEMDFRNIWKQLLEGIVLHEAANLVVALTPDAPAAARNLVGLWLQSVDGIPVTTTVTGPTFAGGPIAPLPDTLFGKTAMQLEWSNAFAPIVPKAGQTVRCVFRTEVPKQPPGPDLAVELRVRSFFDGDTAAIARPIAAPGELSQSLCSPWQNDYRECACFYWAASRPDYVNVDAREDGTSGGNNWMEKDRTRGTPAVYIVDDWVDSRLFSHVDLFTKWEELSFIIGGDDEDESQ